jgi:phage gpG-like protein
MTPQLLAEIMHHAAKQYHNTHGNPDWKSWEFVTESQREGYYVAAQAAIDAIAKESTKEA